ncbi:MAG TPA: substrate-binding domain-containing protein [Hyphomicrobiaceae bacterium]|nr:substrate-binding domain-containing protein [Hyphomicrobiaceae bacterium]
MRLEILSGGAAQGLVAAVTAPFKAQTGFDIGGSFGAVGAMRDKLLAGTPADVLILTAALIAELTAGGHVVAGSAADLGVVRTAVAVRSTDASPPVGDADGLRAALLAADAIYFPDPTLATAGIHFAKVLDRLGIRDAVADRLRPHPNGATAMREMARARGRPIGCTQVTEILNTPGVTLVAPLPQAFELATTYTAGIATLAASPEPARRLIDLLSSAATKALRDRAGFEAT